MLASTVQFSNNNQPPATPQTTYEYTGAGIHEDTTTRPHPQTPNSAPDTPSPHTSLSTPKQYSRPAGHMRRIVNVPPMSRPPPDTRRRNGPGPPKTARCSLERR